MRNSGVHALAPELSTDVTDVEVFVIGNEIKVDPVNVQIPWKAEQTIRWTTKDPKLSFIGVIFAEPSPFSPYLDPTGKYCELTYTNTDPESVGKFKYDLILDNAHLFMMEDPTVQNDSPPPMLAS